MHNNQHCTLRLEQVANSFQLAPQYCTAKVKVMAKLCQALLLLQNSFSSFHNELHAIAMHCGIAVEVFFA